MNKQNIITKTKKYPSSNEKKTTSQEQQSSSSREEDTIERSNRATRLTTIAGDDSSPPHSSSSLTTVNTMKSNTDHGSSTVTIANTDVMAKAVAAATLASLNDVHVTRSTTRTTASSTSANEVEISEKKMTKEKQAKRKAKETKEVRVIKKRNRERQRRDNINSQFENLTNIVKHFESEDVMINSDLSGSNSSSCTDNDEGHSSFDKPNKRKKKKVHIPAGTISSRIDLIARTISILERMHDVNASLRHKAKGLKRSLKEMKKSSDLYQAAISDVNDQSPTSDRKKSKETAKSTTTSLDLGELEPLNINTSFNTAATAAPQMPNEFMNATLGMMMPFLSTDDPNRTREAFGGSLSTSQSYQVS